MVRCGGACSSTSEYCEFLMGDMRVSDRHASYHSETSTSGRGEALAQFSPRQGVTVVSPDNPRIPIDKPIRHLFGVDYLGPNLVTEAERAKYQAEYLISDSVKWRIPGPRESLSSQKTAKSSSLRMS